MRMFRSNVWFDNLIGNDVEGSLGTPFKVLSQEFPEQTEENTKKKNQPSSAGIEAEIRTREFLSAKQ